MDFDDKPKIKDMGEVEILRETDNPNPTGIALWLPNGDEPYSYHAHTDAWIGAFGALVDRIEKSSKYTKEEKEVRIKDLREANESFVSNLDPKDKMKLVGIINIARGHI